MRRVTVSGTGVDGRDTSFGDQPSKAKKAVPTLIDLLRPQKALWGTIRGEGQWGVSFPPRGDLLFFRVDRGGCQLRRTGMAPVWLATADCLIMHTRLPFSLTSDAQIEPVDSWALVRASRSTEMRVGAGGEPSTVIRGGRISFDVSGSDLPLSLLPAILHAPHDDPRSERLLALLAMVETEAVPSDAWSASASASLLKLVLIELLRIERGSPNPLAPGLLAGLNDPVVSRALEAMHGDIAHPWTLMGLAKSSGRSRSGFSERFRCVLGMAPMVYLKHLRIAVAKNELRQGRRSVSEIAFLVGFQSSSAFSSAFSRAVGCSAIAYADG